VILTFEAVKEILNCHFVIEEDIYCRKRILLLIAIAYFLIKNHYRCILSASKRGKGTRVKGNFHLKRGDVLKILVGQEGGVNTVSGGTGGGGGSFVVTDDNTPLLIGK